MSIARPYVPSASRAQRTKERFRTSWREDLKIWWREIDRFLLLLVALLMLVGTAAVAAASPASAERLSTADVRLDEFLFLKQHLMWQALGIGAMIGASMLSRDDARRLGILIAGGALVLMFLVPFIGSEVNGARRWIDLGMRFQPSEFLKSGFAILLAWILSWRLRDPGLPVIAVVTAAMGIVALLLMM